MIYVLLPDKKSTNTILFCNLKLLKLNLNPTLFLIDFEKAIKNSIQTKFSQTKMLSYFFIEAKRFGDIFKNMVYQLNIVGILHLY